VIVYANREETVDTRAFLRRVEGTSCPVERLILRGQLEAGVADVLCPERDEEICLNGPLPERITIRTPEGYAFYCIHPEMYQDAALRFLREQQPARSVVIGIRSIGASLSKVVADAVEATWRFTVRPRGHPFCREVRLGPGLESGIRKHADDWFLIVDEGPGLSGSSFMSVAGKLGELGIPDGRIILFPSHVPDSARFVSDSARTNWHRYKIYIEPSRADRFLPAPAREISGGAWREILYESEVDYPATQPQHERRKYLENRYLWKFSGLAHFGRARLERAQRLSGFIPGSSSLTNGFLVTEWVDGRPASLNYELLDRMAEYLAFLRAEFATDQPVPGEALEHMIEVNTGQKSVAPTRGVVVAGDGRMLPQEWIETTRGYLKTDALDHHDDHFFPGNQDIAWDIAGAAVEWGFAPEVLIDRYVRLQFDPTLRDRIGFYTTAYKAYRFGYCRMAIDSLGGSADGRRFMSLLSKYS
jgi:hypothetical protein